MRAIKVLIVDDSVVVRHIVAEVLRHDADIEVIGFAPNGRIAVQKAKDLRPDLITMDIEMPVLDGIEAVREIRSSGDRTPIIMFSTLTERGASATLDALSAGATDYVTKPSNSMSREQAMADVADQLIARIKALVPVHKTEPVHPQPLATLARRSSTHSIRAVVVGSSTGGPDALNTFLGSFREPLPVPMLITQHMPPMFTAQLAARLNRLGVASVREAADGDRLQPSEVLVAPGGRHLTIHGNAGTARVVLSDAPPVNYCRPSVDVMIDSAIAVHGGELLAVILTGMGSDGMKACQRLVDSGGSVYAQDELSSVVWGMPGAVARAGLAEKVVPIGEMASAVEKKLRESTTVVGHRTMGRV